MSRCLVIPFALAAAAYGQTLVETVRTAEIRQAFDRSTGPSTLRCDISPLKPVLTYGFRFHTGYRLTFPMSQYSGPDHRVSVHVRIVPEGRPPVYLTTTKMLPAAPDPRADAAEDGTLVVGEGSYSVDLLALDDEKRFCRSNWTMQARRAGNERLLAPAVPPLTVAESGAAEASSPPVSKRDVARVTILLNAMPMMPRSTKLTDYDIELFTSSIASLLRQWPARSVRLIAFNIPQRDVIIRKDNFELSQMDDVTQKLQQTELGTIDYRKLANAGKPLDFFADLAQKELSDPHPPDALLVLSTPLGSRPDDLSQIPEKRATPAPIFYLQYIHSPSFRPFLPNSGDPTGGASARRAPIPDDVSMPTMAVSMVMADAIQKLVARLRGDTFPIRSPHDLAEAIHRIDSRIARTAPPPESENPPQPVRSAENSPPVEKTPELRDSTSGADPIDVLAALRDRVLEHGQTIPNHTCVETVERSRYNHTGQPVKSCDAVIANRRQMGSAARLRLDSSDRLRLDVALTVEREIYSWAGAHQFDDRDIDEIVPQGAMGTGPFASFLLSVFLGRPPRFVFDGETTVNDRGVYEYSFDVPKPESHFRFKAHKEWLITGYSGKLFVDPRTSDLLRLIVHTEELPPETETCEVDTTLDYGKVQLSSGLFFLPATTKQSFVGRDSEESVNVYTFASCRDFQAESSINFGENASKSVAGASVAPASVQLPVGLPALIEVLDSIDSDTAAAGDRIRGRFVQAVKDEHGRLLIPEGTPVTGRLMRVEVRYPSPSQVTIALRWETMDLSGDKVPLHLDPNRKVKPGTNIQLGGIAALAQLKRRGVEFELPLPGEEHFNVYHFAGKRAQVESGLRTEWVTAKP
jgi:hypothetical protein